MNRILNQIIEQQCFAHASGTKQYNYFVWLQLFYDTNLMNKNIY